jgi:2-polyprenyl-3-methyl-5-hydroxy-6-metoxy-1,4-benzoquinol methylase
MLPIDIATAHTMSFLDKYLSEPGLRILEIGCGHGHLARALAKRGARVLAIDSSHEAIEQAIALTKQDHPLLNFAELDFWQLSSHSSEPNNLEIAAGFDIVLGTRSLHHIEPLDTAVEKAMSLLKPQGWLLVEDFYAELMDEDSLDWAHKVQTL